jgi:hypothetical protein
MGAVGVTRAQARAAVGPRADARRRPANSFRVLRELGVPELADRSTDRALPPGAIARPKPWYCRSFNFERSARSDIVQVSWKRSNPAQRQGRADCRRGSQALVDVRMRSRLARLFRPTYDVSGQRATIEFDPPGYRPTRCGGLRFEHDRYADVCDHPIAHVSKRAYGARDPCRPLCELAGT